MKDKSLPASIALAITVLAVAAAMVEAAKGMEEKESRDLPFSRLHGPDGLLSKLAKMNVTKDQKDMGIWNIIDSDQKHDRIVGGQQASAGQFKFFASLVFDGFVSCGASFISRRHILTAAHCLYPPEWVVISTTTVQFNSLNYGQGVEIRARRIDLHPQWDPYTMSNDFAVIELESDAVAADIQIVTLDDGSVNRVGQMATAIGFGYTSEGGYPPDVLRYVDIPVLANADCTNSTAAIGVSMLNSMLCAGSSGKDTCQGDSGGPLVIRNSLVQVGITSFGLGCARPTYPGAVYSRVSAGKAWIDTIKSRASPTPLPPTPTLTPGIADTCAAPKTVTCGQTIYASMASATSNDPDSLTDGFVDQWYLFSGNNREVTVSTCSSLTNFDTVLEVFTGQCRQLNSVAYNDDNYCEEGSSLSSTAFFEAYRGTQYRIRVRPFSDADAAYRYSLTIQCGPAIATATPTPTPGPPTPTLTPGIADTCAAPKTVTCGQTIYASMASATSNDPDSLTDGFVDQWYLFSGNNHEVTVSTCSSLTNFDTVLEVFTGQCRQLNSVAYNDDNYCEEGSSLASTVIFDASQGTQYRIRIRPFSDTDTTYRYSLTIQCDPMVTTTSPSPTRSRTPVPTRSRTPVPTRSRTPVPTRSRTPVPTRSRTPTPTRTRSPSPAPYANDVCASPRALSCGSTITASLRNATSTDPDSLNDGYADMWYSITGQGRAITLSTCHNATSFDTYLEAFTGACSSLSRAAQNDDTALSCNTNIGKITSLLTWTAQTNTLYRVRVRGYNGAKGNYGLITTCA